MTARQIQCAGHFGEFLQGRLRKDGPVALVTVPCNQLRVKLTHIPGPGLSVHGCGQRLITPNRTRSFLARLDQRLPGRLVVRADMPAGGGAGASTAARVAMARLADPKASAEEIATACIACEGASDPLMYDRPERLLWASRRGRILRVLPPLPRMEIVGGFWGPNRPTDPGDSNFADISDLIDPWVLAAAAGDVPALARLASLSADRTLALRGPDDDPIAKLARETGAFGYIVAHTGSARGLIFAPGATHDRTKACLALAGFRQRISFVVGG